MPERILNLSHSISTLATSKVKQIQHVTGATKILALNAEIEAARAGQYGKGFAVVAQEVKSVSQQIAGITQDLTKELHEKVADLDRLGNGLVANIRGRRLTDLALNMIEIIDRNLYERSCDVRWWATDSAVVDCLGNPSETQTRFASSRLGVILKAYTVYLDLWIVDRNGMIVANGRPDRYPRARGGSVAQEQWFRDAMRTSSGDEFVVADIERNPTLDNKMVATYAASIRKGGDAHGEPLGALGIFFDWEAQSQTVVESVRLEPEEKSRTRCLLVDSRHRILAASDRRGILTESFPLPKTEASGAYVDSQGNTVGYAATPGYETYRGLGWSGVLVQSKVADE